MQPTRSIHLSRKAWFAVASLAVVVVVLIRSNSTVLVNSYPRMNSYQAVNDRAIVLTVAVGPRSWTRVTEVTETPTEVRVKVESLVWPIPLPGTSELEIRNLTVSLADALGARIVRDANGQVIPPR